MRLRLLAVALLLPLLAVTARAEDKATQQVTIKTPNGAPAMELTVAKDAKVTAIKDMTAIVSKDLRLYLWLVPAAKTLATAEPLVGEIIKDEFIRWMPTSKSDLKVAGAPALHLLGKGKEADDMDPGQAEVVLFTVGGQIFAACIHGEDKDSEAEHAPMLAVLATAKAP